MKQGDYIKYGYCYYPNFFKESELEAIEGYLNKFHKLWLKDYAKYYDTGVLNSHSLTSLPYLNRDEKNSLLHFISQDKLVDIVPFKPAKFFGTQLFFDPKNKAQENYWHRDIQYNNLSDAEQKEAIKTQNAIHIRIPLVDEPGIELIPETHRKWDTEETYNVRNSLEGKKPSDAISTGKLFPLKRMDVLLFSANMIHRGLYGNNRFSFDVLFSDDHPDILQYRNKEGLPKKSEINLFHNAHIF